MKGEETFMVSLYWSRVHKNRQLDSELVTPVEAHSPVKIIELYKNRTPLFPGSWCPPRAPGYEANLLTCLLATMAYIYVNAACTVCVTIFSTSDKL